MTVSDTAHEPVPPVESTPWRPGTGRPGRPSPGWTELLAAAVAYLPFSLLAGLVLFAVTPQPGTVAVVAATGVATLLSVAVALVLRVRWLPALGLRPTTARWLLLGLAGGVLGWLVNRFVIVGYMILTGDTSNPQQGLADSAAAQGWELAGMLAFGALLVPFAEELLFRGIGYGALRRYGVWVAMPVSAVVFGLAHGVNVVLPAAIVLGVIGALLYERSGSIWPSVVMHATNNAIVFVSAAILLG